jgi:pimeloyl-ACP methyl ester carboxylesterase
MRVLLVALCVGALGAGWIAAALSVAERDLKLAAAPERRDWALWIFQDGGWIRAAGLGDLSPLEGATVLIHGLDEPGDVWDDLAPALDGVGRTSLRFTYPNDQAVADSALMFAGAMERLGATGLERVDIVGHSMGGLVAREALTREGVDRSSWPEVRTLVMVATPHGGSAWAAVRSVAELRDRGQRALEGRMTLEEAVDLSSDGGGEAARDLAPGSRFLTELNARPHPAGVRLVCVVGRWLPGWADGAVGDEVVGDGVVSVASATLAGADEVIEVRGNHRGMLRAMSGLGAPEAVPAVVEALAQN